MNGDDAERLHDRALMAARWLAIGVEDLRVARLCLNATEPSPVASAYHCQQAAEKLVKGLLVLADSPFTKTHDLVRLGTLALPAYPQLASLLAATHILTSWAFEYRYPGPDLQPPEDPTETELKQAMDTIDALATALRDAVRTAPQ